MSNFFSGCLGFLQNAEFDAGYDDYSPTFQVFLSHIEPIELYLHESGDRCVWYTDINLPGKYVLET